MKMICNYAEKCKKKCMLHYGKHDKLLACGDKCEGHPESECIPYVDPILKRIQERFAEWADAKIDETGILLSATVNLDRIIQEESAK